MNHIILTGAILSVFSGCSFVHYSPQAVNLNTPNPKVYIETKSHNIQNNSEVENDTFRLGAFNSPDN